MTQPKWTILTKYFYGPGDHSFGHPNLSALSSTREELLLSQVHPFQPRKLIWGVLAILYQLLHNFYSISQGLKSSQHDENMMSCTRIYMDPTQDLMGQPRKTRLLILLEHQLENMKGQNSLFTIMISKDSKKVFKQAEKIILRAFVINICFHRIFPYPNLELCTLHAIDEWDKVLDISWRKKR